MNPKTKRARQGGNPNLALIPNQSTINKESFHMLSRNTKLSKVQSAAQKKTTQLSWEDFGDNSVFGYEIGIAADPSCHSFLPPNPLFSWLLANKLDGLLFKSLDRFCPLFGLYAYYGEPSLWFSPPPSGADNTVGIIIGRDSSGHIRAIGTNLMSDPTRSINTSTNCVFTKYDSLAGNSLGQSRLIENEISARMTAGNIERAKEIENEAFKFRTMAVYILVIDGDNSYLGMDVAIAAPSHRPSDMSYEFVGEII